ncbi:MULTISPECIES: DUF5709 domain-containing protein [unclassified Streptomyces]|uniref:DUF5709 domain-containing protein n=1 Tax=unclassified Streptomyces TaxID=2593676 RepID=UPI0021C6DB53|nr:DUF5709 domain-containing protein [Streptomyces sp. FIT100]UUN30556.1 hypothetical protein KK483_32640 [Streptomyces sp. FIT100]
MSDEARGDDVYQPEFSDVKNPPADDLDLQNVLDEPDLDGTLDEGYSPLERPLGVDRFGTTGEEQMRGAPLDERLAQELSDVEPPEGDGIGDLPADGEPVDEEAGDARTGRLLPEIDATGCAVDMIAHDVGVDGGAASAEEAAMHTIPDEEEGEVEDLQ